MTIGSIIPDPDVIKTRNKTYLTNAQREQLRETCISEAEYYEKLETEIEIKGMEIHEIERISDLSFRVNKCTNGYRYSVNEVKKMFNDKHYQCYSVYVKDKFSDLGLVGAIISHESIVELFCLSCRALGRKIEERMLEFILEKSKAKKCIFKTTSKNEALYDLIKAKKLILID